MDMATYIQNAIKADRAATFAQSDQLALGEILTKCEQIKVKGYECHDGSEPNVRFDFEYACPTGIDSWRGIYSELALSFSFEGGDMPLSSFIELLKGAIGKTFTGYKGGEHQMSRHTPVWVANYGNSGNTAVIDVVDDEYQVVIMTGYREA